MGMAASQARYLALVARKSNCEYEGQQINQSRTALSNQSANLFNQMLGLSVPVPPSTQDYTKTQYSFKSGDTTYTIDSWKQLSNADPDYNYIVDYHYNADVYTGSEKKLGNPQVQMSNASSGDPVADLETIRQALEAKEKAEDEYQIAVNNYNAKVSEAKTLSNYSTNTYFKQISNTSYHAGASTSIPSNSYTFNYYAEGGETQSTATYSGINSKDSSDKYVMGKDELTNIVTLLQELSKNGAIDDNGLAEIKAQLDAEQTDAARTALATAYPTVFYDKTNKAIAFSSDLEDLDGIKSGGNTSLSVYSDSETITGTGKTVNTISTNYSAKITELEAEMQKKLQTKNDKTEAYNNLVKPTYVGNCPLTLLTELTEEQEAEIRQIVVDMKANNITTNIADCYDPDTKTYKGGIYSFEMNGQKYYTTYDDLVTAYPATYGNNDIDCQTTLPYYNASYVNQKINVTSKALIQTGSSGVFESIKFENDSVVYSLNMETITDDDAYNDAMNEYYYQNAKYDKTVQDINAKTSLIQQEDQQLELRLKQLETEQNALKTEIDAVQGIIKDNVEKSFKTFSG